MEQPSPWFRALRTAVCTFRPCLCEIQLIPRNGLKISAIFIILGAPAERFGFGSQTVYNGHCLSRPSRGQFEWSTKAEIELIDEVSSLNSDSGLNIVKQL